MGTLKPTVLKNASGEQVYPVTHAKGVFVNSTKTLATELTEIKASITPSGNGGGTEGIVNPSNVQYVKVKSTTVTTNLFNNEKIEKNGYYNDAAATGAWLKDRAYVSSELISVIAGQVYTTQVTGMNTFWNNGNYVGYSRLASFTIPVGANQVRLAISSAFNLDTVMLVKGSALPSTYQPYAPTPVYTLPADTFDVEMNKKSIRPEHFSNDSMALITGLTEEQRLERATGKVNLFIETAYDGYNQPIHPSVVAFDAPWNGYKYWMGYTPYPYAIDETENPAIAASNDLIKWVTPTGYSNPLDTLADGTTTFFSDTHLVYRADLNRLECWYNKNSQDNTSQQHGLFRKTTTDGKNWSARERMRFTMTSPAIIWDDNKYKMWTFYTPERGYHESDSTGKVWTYIGNFQTDTIGDAITSWHGNVIKTPVGYEMVVQPLTNDCPTIDYYNSTDGKVWGNKQTLVKNETRFGIDVKGFYRPALLLHNKHYYLFTSTINADGERGITLSYTTRENDISSLKGIDMNHVPFMATPTVKPKNGKEQQIIFDKVLNKAIICTTGGRYAVWKDFEGNIV